MDKELKSALVEFGIRFITDKFLKKLVIYGLNKLARSTDNDIDDIVCRLVADKLKRKDAQ